MKIGDLVFNSNIFEGARKFDYDVSLWPFQREKRIEYQILIWLKGFNYEKPARFSDKESRDDAFDKLGDLK